MSPVPCKLTQGLNSHQMLGKLWWQDGGQSQQFSPEKSGSHP